MHLWKVELKDNSGNVLELFDKNFEGLNFSFQRIGGCATASFSLPKPFEEWGYISGNFKVNIYYLNPSTNDYDLWWAGYVDENTPSLAEIEDINVLVQGYSGQLSRRFVSKTYTSTEVSLIVKNLLDTYIVGYTDITYDVADLEVTGFTPDTISFNCNCLDAIRTLAETVGTREWGVGADGKFYFKARSSDVSHFYPIGGKVSSTNIINSFRDIINYIYLTGGKVGGVNFTRTGNDAPSILKYGIRDAIINNSAITTNTVADEFIAAILAEKKDVTRKGEVLIVNDTKLVNNIPVLKRFEDNIPLQLFRFITEGVRYGEKKYGTFLYSEYIDYQIQSITYSIDVNGGLNTKLEIGSRRPNIAEAISQLAFNLDQERQR